MPDMQAFYAMQRRLRSERQTAIDRIMATSVIGTEWSAPKCSFFGVVIRGQKKLFRVCWFDAIGFSGHVETDDPTDELIAMFGAKVELWPGALEYVSQEWIPCP